MVSMRYDDIAAGWTSAGGVGASASLSSTTQQMAQSCADAVVLCRCDSAVATTRQKLSAVNSAKYQRQAPRSSAVFGSPGCLAFDIAIMCLGLSDRIITRNFQAMLQTLAKRILNRSTYPQQCSRNERKTCQWKRTSKQRSLWVATHRYPSFRKHLRSSLPAHLPWLAYPKQEPTPWPKHSFLMSSGLLSKLIF